jgi:flagellar biosynthesis GTPase FlhF
MNKKNFAIAVLLLAAGCAADQPTLQSEPGAPPPMDPKRKISEQDCGGPVDIVAGNLLCMGPEDAERERQRRAEEERQRKLEAERRARAEAEARAAKAKAEAEERARLERERAERLAREEAERKAREAEEARLAAERKAREERERQEREAAEALARQRAEQEAREAAERECRRLEQERLDARVVLEDFVANYGTVDEYREIAGQIAAFLKKPRKPRPCP